MKHTAKTCLVFLLTFLLAFSAPAALASNGPAPVDSGFPSSLVLTSGGSVYTVYAKGTAHNDAVAGVAYDAETNTLTLTGVDTPYVLSLSAMGDDFKLNVKGDNVLAAIVARGWGWGTGLNITGTGKLEVNKDLSADVAICFEPVETYAVSPDNGHSYLTVGEEVTLELYGKAAVFRTTSNVPPTVSLPEDVYVTYLMSDAVREVEMTASGYVLEEGKAPSRIMRAVYDYDENALYGMEITDGGDYLFIRYIFNEENHLYLKDYDSQAVFESLEEAALGGFTLKEEHGAQVYDEFVVADVYVKDIPAYEASDGTRYVIVDGFVNGVSGRWAATMEQYRTNPDGYLFHPTDGVDTAALTPATTTVTLENVYDYWIIDTELNITGKVHEHDWSILKWNETDHWYECSCGAVQRTQPHTGGKATCQQQAVCTVCNQPYGERGDHDYSDLCRNNESHWRECTVCHTATEPEPHTGGTATCRDMAECAVCGQPYGERAPHDFSVPCWDNVNHWTECSLCHQTSDVAPHIGGSATCQQQAVCEQCGHPYGDRAPHAFDILQHDYAGHWYKCVDCNETTRKEDHVGGTATETQGPVCSICGEVYGEPLDPHHGGDDGPMFTLGDVDGDGEITAADARLALRRAVDLETWTEEAVQFLSADVDTDGVVTAADARKILRAAVDLENPADWYGRQPM